MAKLIILSALAWITQDLVRLGNLFKVRFCLWISRIDVGMILPGELSIRSLDLPL